MHYLLSTNPEESSAVVIAPAAVRTATYRIHDEPRQISAYLNGIGP